MIAVHVGNNVETMPEFFISGVWDSDLKYGMFTTISPEYDSSAASPIARELGCEVACTFCRKNMKMIRYSCYSTTMIQNNY